MPLKTSRDYKSSMNRYHIAFTNTAEEGLLDIISYIAADNPVRAVSFVDEIIDSLQKTLSVFPYAGKVAENLEVDQEIRIWPYASYNNYYRVVEKEKLVEVLFVFHASRDIRTLITNLGNTKTLL